jgi:putative SOS response-associated peptidase YedK
MCFTVNVNLIKEELENRYGATLIDPDKYRPSYYYHAFSKPELPVVCSGNTNQIQLFKWGLIPSWTRSISDAEEIRLKTFNARAESLESKKSFSSAFKTQRCLIPVKGFFEWQHVGKEKRPWYIYHYEEDIMSLAGIFDKWTESTTGEVYFTFSIITTEANELMSEIHNSAKRMPVILTRENESEWISTETSISDAIRLLKPCSSGFIKAHTISGLINNKNANKNTPTLIEPYIYQSENLLFNIFL